MGIHFLARVTELINCTDEPIFLYECEKGDPDGKFYPPIELRPKRTKEIAGSRFLNNLESSGKLRTVKVKKHNRDDDFEKESFSARDFIDHQRIYFSSKQDEDGKILLVIEKVKKGGIFAEMFRTKLFRYFQRQKSRNDTLENNLDNLAQPDRNCNSSRALISG